MLSSAPWPSIARSARLKMRMSWSVPSMAVHCQECTFKGAHVCPKYSESDWPGVGRGSLSLPQKLRCDSSVTPRLSKNYQGGAGWVLLNFHELLVSINRDRGAMMEKPIIHRLLAFPVMMLSWSSILSIRIKAQVRGIYAYNSSAGEVEAGGSGIVQRSNGNCSRFREVTEVT